MKSSQKNKASPRNNAPTSNPGRLTISDGAKDVINLYQNTNYDYNNRPGFLRNKIS